MRATEALRGHSDGGGEKGKQMISPDPIDQLCADGAERAPL